MIRDCPQSDGMVCSLRVYHRDIDIRGRVHTGVYVSYFESACNDMLRHFDVIKYFKPQPGEYQYVVRRVDLTFHKPIVIDNLLHARVALSRIGTSSLVFGGRIDRDDDLDRDNPSVSASIVWVCADAAGRSAVPIPDATRSALAALLDAAPTVRAGT